MFCCTFIKCKSKSSPDRPLGPVRGLGGVSSAGGMERMVETSFVTSSCSVLSASGQEVSVVGTEEAEGVVTTLDCWSIVGA